MDVMGYHEAFFLEDTIITILRKGRGYSQEGVIMSDSPNEYYWMWALSSRANGGKVLVGGLGLGILTNILALRRDVEAITVVEIVPEIIKMVKPYLSSYVPIEVVEGDFFKEVPKLSEESRQFDVVIVDLWNGVQKRDEEVFRDAQMLLEDLYPNAQHLYWQFQRKVDEEVVNQAVYFLHREGVL